MDLRRKEHHRYETWRTFALGIGIGAAGATLARHIRGSQGWFSGMTLPDQLSARRLSDTLSEIPLPNQLRHQANGHATTDWAQPATASPIKTIDATHPDAERDVHAFPAATAPIPELPEDRVSPVEDTATHRLDQIELTPDEPISDDEIRTLAWETLRDNPNASCEEVLAAWRVHRGQTIDADEEARVVAVYGGLHEAFDAA